MFDRTVDFLLVIGQGIAEKHAAIYEDEEVIRAIVQSLKVKSKKIVYELKSKKLTLATMLVENSFRCAKDFVSLGGIQCIKEELRSHFDLVFINSLYYEQLLKLFSTVLAHDIRSNDLNDKKFNYTLMGLLQECQNQESLKYVFSIITGLTNYEYNRQVLCQLGVFPRIMKFYEYCIDSRDKEMLFRILGVFARLIKETSFKTQLKCHTELTNNFSPFFEPFNIESTSKELAKLSSLEIIRDMILVEDNSATRQNLVSSGYVKMLVTKCL